MKDNEIQVYCPYCSKEFNIIMGILGYYVIEKEKVNKQQKEDV